MLNQLQQACIQVNLMDLEYLLKYKILKNSKLIKVKVEVDRKIKLSQIKRVTKKISPKINTKIQNT